MNPVARVEPAARSGFARSGFGLIALGALACAPLTLGCGDDDRPAPLGSARAIGDCESFDYEPCDILTEDCQDERFGLMACLHGDSAAGGPPPVRLLDEAAALAFVSEGIFGMMGTDGAQRMQAMAAGSADFRSQVRGFELLGLLDPGQIEDEGDVVEVSQESAAAFYWVPTQEIVIIDRGEPAASLDANGILSHEFVHALQDRRYGLGSLGADAALETDGALALSSLIEGEASLYQYLYLFAASGRDVERLDWPAFFDELAGFGAEATLMAGSPLLTADSIFPYTYGTRYAGEHWVAGGAAQLARVFAAPPSTSWVVALGSPGAPPPPPARFEQGPVPLDGYVLAAEDSVGAWITAAALAARAAPAEAESALGELAARWRGDRLWVYVSSAEPLDVAALWAIEWDDAGAAAEFAALAQALAPAGVTSRAEASGRSTRIVAAELPAGLEAWQASLAGAAPPAP